MYEHDLQLIRQYCDGELHGEARLAFEARLAGEPALARRLEAERTLQSRVATVFSNAPAAPAVLRERVTASLREPLQLREAEPVERGGFRWFAKPRQANFWAMAASLALVGFVVIWGIYAPQIDGVGEGVSMVDLTAEAAIYASKEHNRCAESRGCMNAKIVHRTREEAAFDLSQYLNVDGVIVFDLSEAGFEFLGEGRCKLPGPQPSAHLIYGRDAGERGMAIVSVFVAPNSGQFGCRKRARANPGEWREVDAGPQCQKMVLRTLDCSLVYFLVCCDGSDMKPVAEIIARALANAG
ncbi:MAG TPA: hypothetical protein PK098_07310 [Phycisphaerales bacterium]|nr:hypothetical protein [Phycisphaerales bacterium]